MPQRLQRGGAKEYIGSLMPDVKDAADLAAKCSAFYVCGHGKTDLANVSIVPENTFVIFVGQSGFDTRVRRGPEWLYYSKTREKYFQGLFDSFVKETAGATAKRQYGGQHVYIPGDVIPSLNINFRSGGIQNFFNKGVYECPTRNVEMFTYTDEKLPIIQLAELYTTTPAVKEIINKEFLVRGEATENYFVNHFVPLSISQRILDIKKRPSLNLQSLWSWFKRDKYKQVIAWIDKYLFHHPDNKMPDTTEYIHELGNIFTSIKPTKQYRIFIILACRSPITYGGPKYDPYACETSFTAPDPANLPKTLNSTRRLARRFSFSVKPVCATADDPPMNLRKAMDAFDVVWGLKPIGEKEDKYLNEVHAFFYQKGGKTLRELAPTCEFTQLFMDRVFTKFPILRNESANSEKRAAFRLFLMAVQEALGVFLVGVHMDTADEGRRADLLGQQLIQQARLGTVAAGDPEEVGEILSEQREFVSQARWAKLRRNTARAATPPKGLRRALPKLGPFPPVPPPPARARAVIPPPPRSSILPHVGSPSRSSNQKDLLNWRRKWLAGTRNVARNATRMKQWRNMRSRLTANQRAAQNRSLRRDASTRS